MDDKTIEDMIYFANRYRGKHKTSGPHWSAVNRIPVLFDEMMRLRSILHEIAEEAPKRNTDWCRRKAKEGIEE